MERQLPHIIAITLAAHLLTGATGCATTTEARSVHESGFLGDYSLLHKGEGDEPLEYYAAEGTDWASYSRIEIDSVTLWKSDATEDVDEKEAQILTNLYYKQLHDQLGKIFDVVDQAGPGTLRLRAAITGGQDAAVVANVITSTVPQLKVLATIEGMAFKNSVFVGEASMEAKITDSMSDRPLMMGVDRRLGTKTFRGMFSDWADVEEALTYWAQAIAKDLAKRKGVEFPED